MGHKTQDPEASLPLTKAQSPCGPRRHICMTMCPQLQTRMVKKKDSLLWVCVWINRLG